jgi:hypothetical protein
MEDFFMDGFKSLMRVDFDSFFESEKVILVKG